MSRPEDLIDWKAPDFASVWTARAERLKKLKADPHLCAAVKLHYKHYPADCINDWGVTVDPRVASEGRNPVMPFILMQRQRDEIEFIMRKWKAGSPGVIKKSRDVGASWVCMALACTLALFWDNVSFGFGSAKEEKVDRTGDPDSLFYKGRMYLSYLPDIFRGGWDIKKNSAHMRLSFPKTGSSITGEAGDNIGRGGRKSIYFVDEAAFVERPMLIEASLSANTNCRIDLSSVNGTGNPFHEKCIGGKIEVFEFHWRDDPRKDDAWYEKKKNELDPVIVASELDLDFHASIEGQIIPSLWVQAAIDAHIKLGLGTPTGERVMALDVADQGRDKNACGARYSFLMTHLEEWSGQNSDIYATTQRTINLADDWGFAEFLYDADGLGASVRGDARRINQDRENAGRHPVVATQHRGSAAVLWPEQITPRTMRKNIDFFENYKAQCYWSLRFRFEATYNAVVKGMPFDPGDIISIPSGLPHRTRLVSELSQPVRKMSKTGKLMIDKMPEGTLSPNLADVVAILYGPRIKPLNISDQILGAVSAPELVPPHVPGLTDDILAMF